MITEIPDEAALALEFDVLARRAGLDIPTDRRPALFAGFKDLRRMLALLRQPRIPQPIVWMKRASVPGSTPEGRSLSNFAFAKRLRSLSFVFFRTAANIRRTASASSEQGRAQLTPRYPRGWVGLSGGRRSRRAAFRQPGEPSARAAPRQAGVLVVVILLLKLLPSRRTAA